MYFRSLVFSLAGAFLFLLATRCSAQNSSTYDPVDHPIFQLSSDPGQAFNLEVVLSLAENGGSNTGEVLRIATQISATNEEETYTAFYPMAQSIHALAESIDPSVDPVSARENYFHASSYYRGAAYLLIKNQSDPRLITLWNQQIAAFRKAIALLKPSPGEVFTVRAKNSSVGPYNVPGYFFKAHADKNKKSPTIILINGYDGSKEEIYHSICAEVLRRGMNCVPIEGPGQPSVRRYQNLGFIPDYWTALTPVVDYVFNRTDVDESKTIVMGYSFGGTLAPRAASKEPRVPVIICLDGLASLQKDLLHQFGPLGELYRAGKKHEFNEALLSFINNAYNAISSRYIIQQGLYAFNTQSPWDWFTRLGEIAVTPEIVKEIGQRQVYLGKGQDDSSLKNQPEVANMLFTTERPNGKNLTYFHEFLTRLGAGEHCSIGAETQVWTNIAGWLSRIWGGYKWENIGTGT